MGQCVQLAAAGCNAMIPLVDDFLCTDADMCVLLGVSRELLCFNQTQTTITDYIQC